MQKLRDQTRTDVKRWAEYQRRQATGNLLLGWYVIRRGLWVRYVGGSEVLIRKVPVGTYGQITHRFSKRSNGLCWVLWTNWQAPVVCDIDSLEPVVGAPIGQPRDHLRKWLRQCRAMDRVWRAEREQEMRSAGRTVDDCS
jgi:hypothetical protein